MATINSYFKDFLSNIRLTEMQSSALKIAQEDLRTKLTTDETISKILIATFLQGSYRRSTAVKPTADSKTDVDIIVVTNLDSTAYPPSEALDLFTPFLEKHYRGSYRPQGRSFGIETEVDGTPVAIDLVPTSAPSEAVERILESASAQSHYSLEEFQYNLDGREYSAILESFNEFFSVDGQNEKWRDEPLLIPDRNAEEWEKTHPLEQIRWTVEKNKLTNGHYINVVKALKWWRKTQFSDVSHPKSYPLEHFIGDCCPDGITSIAEGVVLTLEKIAQDHPRKPYLPDRGVSTHDVFGRLQEKDYESFYQAVVKASTKARKALDVDDIQESVDLWSDFFGEEFPTNSNKQSSSVGFQKPTEKVTEIPTGRFA